MSEARGVMRRVSINALTEAGWVAGTVHIPGEIRLEDYLNRASDFLALTEVFLESSEAEIPFLALRLGAIYLLTSNELDQQETSEAVLLMEEHKISCLFSLGQLKGEIKTKPGVRLSDVLARHKTFVPIGKCTYEIRSPRAQKVFREERAVVLLNCTWIIGILEHRAKE